MKHLWATTLIAGSLWLLIAIMLTELIDLSQCSQLQEGINTFTGRVLTPEEKATKAKLEQWFLRAKCGDKKRDS